ncbi:uncharacterized protein LOC123870990 [Maniola jurtina]|uniref:uncharacterized protein LOC123870990 n=1 Tax=Maniola jurtina TaxID=191418 RepID=UPI001E688FED|nr:uncharacterized protein LOC123870990 [Maniola jurtina]
MKVPRYLYLRLGKNVTRNIKPEAFEAKDKRDGEDAVELKEIGREYIDVLKKVPSILEYLINITEYRLDNSEKNDVSITKDDVDHIESSHHADKENNEDRIKSHVKARDIYVRIAPVARVTAEDVMKQVIKVQKKLEELNAKRKQI